MLRTFTGLQKKILRSKGRYRTSQTMPPGKKSPNLEFVNCMYFCAQSFIFLKLTHLFRFHLAFVNCFRSQAQRISQGVHCLRYLRWLSLLALTATLSEATPDSCALCSTKDLLPNYLIDPIGNLDIWFIK